MQSNRQSLGRNRHDRTADPSDDPAGRAPGRPHWAEEETQGPGQDDRGNSHCRRHRHRARCAGVVLCIPGGRLQGRGHDRLRHPGLHPVHGGGQRHHQSQGLRHRHARLGHHSGALRPGGRLFLLCADGHAGITAVTAAAGTGGLLLLLVFPEKERVIFQCLHILCAAQKDPHATFVKE